MRAAEWVRRPGPRLGSERSENDAWKKACPWAKRLSWQPQGGRVKQPPGLGGWNGAFFSSLLLSAAC